MKISAAKIELFQLSKNVYQSLLQVNGAKLNQIKQFKYLGVAFTNDGIHDKKLRYLNWHGKRSTTSFALFGCHETTIVKKYEALDFQSRF